MTSSTNPSSDAVRFICALPNLQDGDAINLNHQEGRNVTIGQLRALLTYIDEIERQKMVAKKALLDVIEVDHHSFRPESTSTKLAREALIVLGGLE